VNYAKQQIFFIARVALACEKMGLEGKFVPPQVVEGMIYFAVTSLLFPMMRMNKFSSK
jgi:hypothetical protein